MRQPETVELTTESLEELLEQVHDGTIQVPEFQRAVVWDDDGIKLLLASVSLSYPIGAVKLLRAGSREVRFASHPVAGAPSSSIKPRRLLLDGQHRIAALYQVLASGRMVPTHDAHDKPIHRWYYIDINAALDPDVDRDEAITSVPETRELRGANRIELDVTTPELEWEQCLFPLSLVFGSDAELRRWKRGFAEFGARQQATVRERLIHRFDAEVLDAFRTYLVPTIIIGKERTRWAVRVHGGRDGRNLSDLFRVTEHTEHTERDDQPT